MNEARILWVDDEIDLLKPHILFLEEKGYKLKTVNNGNDAIEMVKNKAYDLIFLDENMPGLSGLETLSRIKNINSSVPIIMITKSEEECIMDEAIGSKIQDYLIKPVNPKQILMAIKKTIDQKRLIVEKATSDYQAEFANISQMISQSSNSEDWKETYKKLVFWELELEKTKVKGMEQILNMQKTDANIAFSKFIKKNYSEWFSGNNEDAPILSHNIFQKQLFPILEENNQVVVFLIDNLRYDQWKTIESALNSIYKTEKEELFYSILPTATQFARNAMFAGLMPAQIEQVHPKLWVNEGEENGKNDFEKELLELQMQRMGVKKTLFYEKFQNIEKGKKIKQSFSEILNHELSVIVINFVDILSHTRTEMNMIKELIHDEVTYRSLTLSWFEHSPLFELIKALSERKLTMVFTTDHGSIRVNNAVKIVGDKNISSNLRYKQGKLLKYNPKELFEMKIPEKVLLPKLNVSSSYIFAQNNDFFAYPNKFNHYAMFYKDSFQHGGVSLEEMIIPFAVIMPK